MRPLKYFVGRTLLKSHSYKPVYPRHSSITRLGSTRVVVVAGRVDGHWQWAAGQEAERGRVSAALWHRGGVPGRAAPAALEQGLGLRGLRPPRLCRAQGPRGLPVQPLQAPSRADRGHRVPLDQTAADHLAVDDLSSEPEQGLFR